MRQKILLIEMIVGGLAMVFGGILTWIVWNDGYFIGALMLIATGFLSCFLSWKMLGQEKGYGWQDVFFTVFRRTLFVMNLILSLFVIFILISMISY